MGSQAFKISSPELELLLSKENVAETLLPEKDLNLFNEMMDAYWAHCLGNKGFIEGSVSQVVTCVLDMLRFTGKAPWFWTELDFDKWGYDVFKNRKDGKDGVLGRSTQRKYQVSIKLFTDYVCDIPKFKMLVASGYGIKLQQICHRGNMMPHMVEHNATQRRLALSHADVDLFFETIDDLITEAAAFGTKAFLPLLRDKAMFYTIYAYGLRSSETVTAEVDGFSKNHACPQFGDYGFLMVTGKGANGSGPRVDTVPLTDPEYPELIKTYLEEVRPLFLLKADANETALFLSERGKPLCRASVNSRFDLIMSRAGIKQKGKCPHSLRHSTASHESERFSITTTQRRLRHVNASTTQNYTHIRDAFVAEEIERVTSRTPKENV